MGLRDWVDDYFESSIRLLPANFSNIISAIFLFPRVVKRMPSCEKKLFCFLRGRTLEILIEIYEQYLFRRSNVAYNLDILPMKRNQVVQVVQPSICKVCWFSFLLYVMMGRSSEQV